ncbi:hypothetical protein FQR65_LT01110 [Abscondita terminalis]|nr:hypothetical protein FQR65_LT01110 [Abscondita terminalis]
MSTTTTSVVNNRNGRSRSPSPGMHASHLNNATNTAKSNFLNPDYTNLRRSSRSTTPDSAVHANGIESIPLIDAGKAHVPPLANPEIDDNLDDREVVEHPYPGVDDGFFSNNGDPNIILTSRAGGIDEVDVADGVDGGKQMPKRPMSPTDGTHRHFPDIEHGLIPTDLESIPDINVYQHKKTLAQGMMDLALFSANANQLRYVLESNQHPYYYPGVILISISLIFQVAIGVGLIWNSRYNVKDEKEICIANKVNNFTIIGIFLVTVVNVFISAFGVASVQPVAAATRTP